MITILLRILAFLWVLWLLRRLLGLFYKGKAGPAKANPTKAEPKNMVKDPVCGMYMDPRLALRLQQRDEEVFFCSEECRRRFQERSQ